MVQGAVRVTFVGSALSILQSKRLSSFLGTLLFLSCLASPAHAGLCRFLFGEQNENVSRAVQFNQFMTDRSLSEYYHLLHKDFYRSLSSLKSTDVWIDLGAGKGIAAEDYLKSFSNNLEAAQVILVAYKLDRWFKPSSYNGKLNLNVGKLFEDFQSHEVPQAHLITDVFGVLSYTRNLSVALQKTLDLLVVGGELYIHSRSYETGIQIDGKNKSIEFFLRAIPGLEVEGKDGILKVTKKQKEILVPSLKLLKIDETKRPPFRTFNSVL